jgi:predicted ATP-grasp superfamily ATP-dependent carboligase
MLNSLVKAFSFLSQVQVIIVTPTSISHLVPEHDQQEQAYRAALQQCQAVLLVAPESAGLLWQLTKLAESIHKRILGSPSSAIAISSDKLTCLKLWQKKGLPAPCSVLFKEDIKQVDFANFNLPYVLKPNCGAGGESITKCGGFAELRSTNSGHEDYLLQEYIEGEALSVSCLIQEGNIKPLSLNRQHLTPNGFVCHHVDILKNDPREDELFDLAILACSVIPSLNGFVGVDLVYGRNGPVLMEINARITMAFSSMDQEMQHEIARSLTLGRY